MRNVSERISIHNISRESLEEIYVGKQPKIDPVSLRAMAGLSLDYLDKIKKENNEKP